jgi:hypothetical protein
MRAPLNTTGPLGPLPGGTPPLASSVTASVGTGLHVGLRGGQAQRRGLVHHAERARRGAGRQGPQLQRLVVAFAVAAHALQRQLLLLGIEGHQHRGGGLVVGQHGHVLHHRGVLQLVAQVQPDHHGQHGGQRAGGRGAAPQRQAAQPAAGLRLGGVAGVGGVALAFDGDLGLLGVDHVADARPHGRVGHDGGLQLGHACEPALPDQRRGAHRRLFARHGFEAAAGAAAQGAERVAGGEDFEQFGVGSEFHGRPVFFVALKRSVPCRREVFPARAGSMS